MLSEGPTEQESRVVSDHYSYLKELMEQGTVILAGRTQNTDYSSFGIVIFNAQSLEMARKVVENDPAVKKTVMRAELYPYRIAMFNADNTEQRRKGHGVPEKSLTELEGASGSGRKQSCQSRYSP